VRLTRSPTRDTGRLVVSLGITTGRGGHAILKQVWCHETGAHRLLCLKCFSADECTARPPRVREIDGKIEITKPDPIDWNEVFKHRFPLR
jgi:hypothetical protein